MARFSLENLLPTAEFWQIANSWLRSIFLEDWLTKTIALVIALGLWYGVTSRRAPTTKRLDRVQLIFNLPPDTEISNEYNNNIEITLTGDRSRLDGVRADNTIVSVDLAGYKPDELVVQLKPETVNLTVAGGELPGGVRLDEIVPNLISIRLEPRVEKQIEVRPAFSGQLPDTLEIYTTRVTPQTVRVRGAASRLNPLTYLQTEKIELLDKTGGFAARQITLELPDQKITVLDAVVDVAVSVGEKRIEKSFAGVKVRLPNEDKFAPETAVVTFYGPRSIVEKLLSQEFYVQLDAADDENVKPRVVLPPEIEGKIEVRAVRTTAAPNPK